MDFWLIDVVGTCRLSSLSVDTSISSVLTPFAEIQIDIPTENTIIQKIQQLKASFCNNKSGNLF